MSLEELEKRVRVLEDLEAIKKLKARYGQVCDNGYDADELAAMFTEDALFLLTEKGETQKDKGRDAIRQRFKVMPQRIAFADHHFVSPIIELKGDKAEASWLMWTPATLADGKCVFGAGVERDKYEKVNGKWLISETHLEIFFRAPYGDGWGEIKLAPPPD